MPPPLVHIIAGSGPADAGQKVLPAQMQGQSGDAAVVESPRAGHDGKGERGVGAVLFAVQCRQSKQLPRAAER